MQANSNPSDNLNELLPGHRLRDRYVIRQKLGEGGFGKTYLVEDTGRFNEKLVVKEFSPGFLGTAALKKAVELFQREAATLYQLQHPQIPRFWEFFQQESRLFLVQDFVEGKTLASLCEQGIRFKETEIVKLFQDILPVLSYLHHQGVIHRDISPDNIIISAKTGLPVLIDLGAAKQVTLNALENTSHLHGTTIGKTGFAPNEQMQFGIVAPHSDLYALSVTAIVLMTGKDPRDLLDQYNMEWIWNRYITVSPSFSQILNSMLHPRPEKRFHSANEILSALNYQENESYLNKNSNNSHQEKSPNLNSHQGTYIPDTFITNPPQNNNQIQVPNEIKGWNWGAFLLGPFWSFTNQVWIGLLCFIPYLGFIMAIILGFKGNEWAWKSRNWSSIEAFKAHQKAWTIASLIVFIIIFLLGILSDL